VAGDLTLPGVSKSRNNHHELVAWWCCFLLFL